MRILDARPEVGIFEVVDGVFLKDSEPVQYISSSGEFFDGENMHFHSQAVKTLVAHSPYINEDIKTKFRHNPAEYLKYPRGRVDYNTITHKYHIMSVKKFLTDENVEKITREFHLPPFVSGNIVLESDEGHYNY